MSKVGYIFNSYGSSLNVSIANTYGYNVLQGMNLPANSIIISSAVDDDLNDVGSYSVLMTDYQSTPVRLTYTIKEGDGLEYVDDSIKLNIDNKTIIENSENELSINIKNLVDDKTIKYNPENDNIYIQYDNLSKASKDNTGLYKIDGKSIKISEDRIYVDTSKLQYANTNTNNSGIIIGDGNIVVSNQGVLSVNQENITKASSTQPGFIHSIGNEVNIENGTISIDTAQLDKCHDDSPGIVNVDNDSIGLDENNSLKVNTKNLSKAGTSNPGVFKYDDSSFIVEDGLLSFKNNDKYLNMIDSFSYTESQIEKFCQEVDYLLNEYQVAISKPSILDFHCSQLLTGVLQKPLKLNEDVDEMPAQFVDVVFMLATNCPFKISVTFTDNVDPQFSLHEINYNDVLIYHGNEGLQAVYQTTEGKTVPLKFTFIGKNYFNEDKSNFSNKIKIKIVVSYANDGNIFKEILYSIIRYNSGYSKEINYNDTNIENINKIEY